MLCLYSHKFASLFLSALPKLAFPKEVVPFVDADPFEFVSAMADSSAVVTDSFHGLQFSTVFGKPFVALGSLSDPKSNASRLVDFCARYGLSGGVQDIERFRAGAELEPADFSSFDSSAFSADRVRSAGELKSLLRRAFPSERANPGSDEACPQRASPKNQGCGACGAGWELV